MHTMMIVCGIFTMYVAIVGLLASTQINAYLSVVPPGDIVIPTGSTLTLTCTDTDWPPRQLVWQRCAGPRGPCEDITAHGFNSEVQILLLSPDSLQLKITDITAWHSSSYRCVAGPKQYVTLVSVVPKPPKSASAQVSDNKGPSSAGSVKSLWMYLGVGLIVVKYFGS